MNLNKHLVIIYVVVILLVNWFFNNYILLRDYNDKRQALHTITEIHILARNRGNALKAIDAAYERIRELEKKMSYFDPQSETSQVNNKAIWGPVPISDDMLAILERALEGSVISEGAFDITATPITRLYGFGTEEKRYPASYQIKEKLLSVGYKYIVLDKKNKTVSLTKKGMMIDLGGIMKGYAVDEAVKVLKQYGIKDGLVNAGGNIYAFGTNHGKPWKIGIRNPRASDKITSEIITLSNNGCATSGDYEQYFFKNNRRVAHIFNPKTGMPSNLENGVISVTVIADTACEADILSTACFVLGKERADQIIKNKTYFTLSAFN